MLQVQRAVDCWLCGVGRALDGWPKAILKPRSTGVDISAHFLALAELRRRWGL